MPEWHGYPVGFAAHPTRPWWRSIVQGAVVYWKRTDGRDGPMQSRSYAWTPNAVTADLERIDRSHPLPAPSPMVGQVWSWPDNTWGDGSTSEVMVTRIRRGTNISWVELANENGCEYPKQWPPKDAVLIAGLGAPWGPA